MALQAVLRRTELTFIIFTARRMRSYLTYVEIRHYDVVPAGNGTHFNIQKLDLPYEQARHFFQAVWWMSRVRSRHTDGTSLGDFRSVGSTGGGFATVQIVAGTQKVTVSDLRSAGHAGTFLGMRTHSESYEPSAFIDLVVQLFRREMPERLGQPWQVQKMSEEWDSFDFTEERLARIKTTSAELLRLFRKGKLAPRAAFQLVNMAGRMGWRELRGEIEAIATFLPPPLEHEKRLAQIKEELNRWQEKLGTEAGQKAFRKRQLRRFGSEIGFQLLEFDGSEEPKPQPVLSEGALEQLNRELGLLHSHLPTDGQRALAEFVRWCETNEMKGTQNNRTAMAAILKSIRAAIGAGE